MRVWLDYHTFRPAIGKPFLKATTTSFGAPAKSSSPIDEAWVRELKRSDISGSKDDAWDRWCGNDSR